MPFYLTKLQTTTADLTMGNFITVDIQNSGLNSGQNSEFKISYGSATYNSEAH